MFQGYSKETFEFFMAIRFNNNRPFFQSNRDWYLRAVREPSLQLVEALAPTVREMDPDMELRPYRVVSHINRDIRFARDKSPYRDNLWLSFRRSGKKGNSLGLYFDLHDDGASYGMGFYRESRALMAALRRKMELESESFLRLWTPLSADFQLVTFPNARVKPPEGVPEALREWYSANGFYLERELTDFDLIRSGALAEEIKSGFTRLTPLYHTIRELDPDD